MSQVDQRVLLGETIEGSIPASERCAHDFFSTYTHPYETDPAKSSSVRDFSQHNRPEQDFFLTEIIAEEYVSPAMHLALARANVAAKADSPCSSKEKAEAQRLLGSAHSQ